MKHSGLRSGIFLFALLGLGLAACIYAYLYIETDALVGKTLSDRNVLTNAAAARLQGSEIIQLHAATAERVSRLGSYFVPSENAVAVIQAIESIGASSGAVVNISSINAAPPDETTHIGRVSAAVSISGTWKEVTEALALFETLPYDRTMDRLTVRTSGGGGKAAAPQSWQADFDLSVGTIQR